MSQTWRTPSDKMLASFSQRFLQRIKRCAVMAIIAIILTATAAIAGTPPDRLDDNRSGSPYPPLAAAILNTFLGLTWSAYYRPPPPALLAVDPRVISKPKFYAIYWDDDWNTHYPSAPTREVIDGLMKDVARSRYLTSAGQYGIGAVSFEGSNDRFELCPTSPGISTDSSLIFNFITCEVGWGTGVPGVPAENFTGVPLPDDDSVYVIFLPPTVTVDQGCEDFGAYHFFSGAEVWAIPGVPGATRTQTYPYVVIPTQCAMENGAVDQRRLTDNLTHELIEATTDPILIESWIDNTTFSASGTTFAEGIFNSYGRLLRKGEAADICERDGAAPAPPAEILARDGTMRTIRASSYWSNEEGRCVSGPNSKWAYVHADLPETPSYRPANQENSMVGAVNTVTRVSTGEYEVSFPRVGSIGGTVRVGPTGIIPGTCSTGGWSWDQLNDAEKVLIQCRDVAGAPRDLPFVASFSSGADGTGAYAYTFADQPGLRQVYESKSYEEYTSNGKAAQITSRGYPGKYMITLPKHAVVGQTIAEVTTVAAPQASCIATGWYAAGTDERVYVDCRGSDGNFVDSEFTLRFSQRAGFLDSPTRLWAFALANRPTTPFYLGDPLYSGTQGTASAPTIARQSIGNYRVIFPLAGSSLGVAIASAYSLPDQEFAVCQAVGWVLESSSTGNQTVDIKCVSRAGLPADSSFVIQYDR